MKLVRRILIATSLLTVLAATSLWAEDEDAPGRAARLQYIQGSVSIQPQGNGDWVEGALNRPLTNADNIWTDKDARTELNVGTGILRLNSESSLTLTNVNDNSVQVQLHQGTLNLRVRKLYDGEIYEVDTPNMAFTVQKSGEYRFDVDPDGDATMVTVFKGQGDATGEGPAVHVKEHERARFTNGNSLAHTFSAAPGYDGFDDWCRVRDKREGSVSAQYVAPGVVGYEDLDEYGTWDEVPTYGPVWRPRHVAVGWAPYRFGHWAYIAPWGWTWVDDAAWGYAPFHYGRWVYTGGYWGWAPGPRYIRPVYAPALVAWFGGAGWGVGLGFGGGYGYGWCPLGWGEPYYPWYHYSRGYYGRVNISNTRITNVYNFYGRSGNDFRYTNMRYPGGRTAVSRETLVNARPVGRSFVNVPERNFQNARLGGRMDLAPDRNSRLGVNAGRQAAIPPQRSFSRPVVSRGNTSSRPGEFNRGGERPGSLSGRMESRPQNERVDARNGHFVPRPGATNSQDSNARLDRSRTFQGGNDSRTQGPSANNGRFVPRPGARAPEAGQARTANPARIAPNGQDSNRGFQGQRNEISRGNSRADEQRPNVERNNVPRPSAGVRSEVQRNDGSRSNPSVRNMPSQSAPANRGMERSNPRPSEGARNGERPNGGQRNSGRPDGGRSFMSVPRPTGQVRSASSYYGSGVSTRGEMASRSYGGNSREAYGSARSYSGNSRGAYSGGGRSFGQSSRGYSEPRSYSSAASRSYSQPSYSQRSMGGGGARYSAPSGGGMRSGGGSFHGGGGGGGGRASSGRHGR